VYLHLHLREYGVGMVAEVSVMVRTGAGMGRIPHRHVIRGPAFLMTGNGMGTNRILTISAWLWVVICLTYRLLEEGKEAKLTIVMNPSSNVMNVMIVVVILKRIYRSMIYFY